MSPCYKQYVYAFFSQTPTKPGYCDVTMHAPRDVMEEGKGKGKQVCASIFHPRADGPFFLSLFLLHSLPSVLPLSPDKKYSACIVTSRQPGFVGGLGKKSINILLFVNLSHLLTKIILKFWLTFSRKVQRLKGFCLYTFDNC